MYKREIWKDGVTPVDAARLNNIEERLDDSSVAQKLLLLFTKNKAVDIDNSTVKKNANGELYVDIDGTSIFIDPITGKIKAKESVLYNRLEGAISEGDTSISWTSADYPFIADSGEYAIFTNPAGCLKFTSASVSGDGVKTLSLQFEAASADVDISVLHFSE